MRNKDKSLTPFYIFIFAALISASALVIAAWITNKGAQPQPAASDPPNTQTQQAPPESAFDTSINPFFDNFSNPTTGYNTALWSCNNCQSGTISSEDGTLRLETGGVDLGLNISSKPSWPSSKVKYIQGDLMLTNDGEPWYETVDLSFNAILTSVFWQTGCLITTSGFSLTQAEFSCEVFTVDAQRQRTYEKINVQPVTINYGEWHTARIEITPGTFELRFYLDDKLIGTHIPQDAKELLKNQHLKAQIGIYTYSGDYSHTIGYFDNVLVSITP